MLRRRFLTLVVLIACQEKHSERQENHPERQENHSEPPPPQPPHDGVTLIQPGAAPRQTLRYHLTRGARTTSELVYDVGLKNDGEGGAMPALVVELDTTVDDVLADGTAKLRITVIRARVRDRPERAEPRDLLRDQAAMLQGVVITEMLAPDGKVTDAHLQTAAGLPDRSRAQLESLSQSLELVAMRLPTEQVGVGATWRERKVLPEGGIRATAETTYTLLSLTGDTVAYANTGLSTGAPQTVDQDGTKIEITNTRGRSDGQGTVDLARYALDVTSTSSFMTTMNVDAPKGTPGAGSSTVEVSMAIRLTPIAAARPDTAPEDMPAKPTKPTRSTTAHETPGHRSVQGAHKAP
jgi:hypothetical protein